MVLHIKDFPDDLHRFLKIEAAKEGKAIYQLIIDILNRYSAEGEKK